MQSHKGVLRDFTFSRVLADCAITTYIEDCSPVKNPVRCLDLSISGEEGPKWLKKHESSLALENPASGRNGLSHSNVDTEVSDSESNYSIIEKTDFNVIYVECTTEGSTYFDCVFRKIARNGMFVITTIDDPSLYGRPPEPAWRCYSGRIVRTCYSQEMAVRLILAAMARSAARFSKSFEVLLASVIKSSITILVKVRKGADSAVKCLKEIKTLAHCSICEERAFLPDNDGFIVDDVKKYLSCDCASQSVGRTVMSLGPFWAGPLGSPSFVTRLLPHCQLSLQTTTFLQRLVSELRCITQPSKTENQSEKRFFEETATVQISSETTPTIDNSLKRKAELEDSDLQNKRHKCELMDPDPAPAFYYNIHKHKPKSAEKLMKIDKIIDLLQGLGFRASRTHFDRAAVKTSCTLRELQTVMSRVT